jgi:hypothetical protein
MNRQQFEHILRAAKAITGADEFVVIGSQAIWGASDSPPTDLVHSMEVDLFSLRSSEDAALVDGSIGEISPFHRAFGYYAHGVSESVAILPRGWRERLRRVTWLREDAAVALCLDPHDLAVSKLAAGRDKDVAFVGTMVRHGLASLGAIRERVDHAEMDPAIRHAVERRLLALGA